MKGLINRFIIGNALLAKKTAIAVVLILLIVVPAASVQGVSTTLTVNADPFVGFTSLTSSLNPSVYGDTVTFTTVVSTSGGAPTGKVVFVELNIENFGATYIYLGEDATAVSLGGDSYEYIFSTSTLAIGNHAIIAGYDDGNGTFPATVGPLQQTVAERIWPTVTITSAPPEISYSTQATFEFSSNTAGTAFECSLSEGYVSDPDNMTWSACSSPQVYTNLSFGGYYGFAVKAQGAPITTFTMAGYQWYIGVPQVTITGGPAEYTESIEATLTFSSDPVGVDLVCYLLEEEYETQNTVVLEEWVPCTSPRTYTGLSRGNAYYFGVKPEGATDYYAATRQWMITRLTLTASSNPSQFGSDVTFTAILWDDSGTTPGGTVSFAEMIYSWPGIWIPQPLGTGSGPIASSIGSYAYTFSTSALAVGSHDIIAMYTDEGSTITSLTITQEVTEATAQAPMITTQPANYTTCAGSSVSFTAAATGTPAPTVQWQTSSDGGTTWNNISGATTAKYAFTAAAGDNGKRYRAVFTNSAGSATSSTAILTVNTAPVVTSQPTNRTVTYGVPSAIFSAAASGTAPSVQWRRSTNGTTWELVSGATTSNLTIANPTVLMSGNQFRAEFSNVCGTAISNAATLTVNKAPVTATAGSYSSMYDGAVHSPSACVVTGTYTGDLSCSNNTDSVGPDVGSGIISPVVDGTGLDNYAITNVDGYWEITPAAVTITAGDYTSTYDGSAHSPVECTVTGDYTSDLSCSNNPALVGPDMGSGSVAPVLVLNGETETNFTVTPQSGSWEITPAAVTITGGDYNGIYDGVAHSPSACALTGAYMGDLSCTNDLASVGPDVGSGSVVPVLVLNGETETNFTVTPQSGSWEITPAAVTISAGDYSGTYDGVAHSPSECTVTGTYTGELSCTNNPASIGPDVGSGSVLPVLVLNDEIETNYSISNVDGSWEITPAILTITADNQKAQYSDTTPELTFQYGSFQGDDDVNDIDTPPNCSTNREISSPAGEYPITCSGGEDNNYTFSYINGTFTVTKENATVTFNDDNPAALQVSAPEGPLDANELNLVLKVKEKLPDMPADTALAGDINNAGLTVKLEPLSGGGAITLNCTAAVEGTGYDGVKTFTCTNSQPLAVDTYDVVALIEGNYYIGVGYDGFTVFDPSLGYATGGGWFYWPGTTEKTNFGFTMKYNKKATNIQGNLLVIRHHADGTISRLKSNALDGLALKDSNGCGIATFSGKSTYETWDPEANEGLGGYVTIGGILFSVYVEDCNEPGTGVDRFWVRGLDKLVMAKPAPANAVTIGGGNIVVPHTPK